MLPEGPQFVLPQKEILLRQTHVRLLDADRDMPAVNTILTYWLDTYQRANNRPTAPNEIEEYTQLIQSDPVGKYFVAEQDGTVRGVFGYTQDVDPRLQQAAIDFQIEDPIQYRFLFLNPVIRGNKIGDKLADEVFMDALLSGHPNGLYYSHERFEKTSWKWHDRQKGVKHRDTIELHNQACRIYSVDLHERFPNAQLLRAA